MGDLRHHVVQALDVLDVHRGPDVDAGGEQLLDVHPALGVAAVGRVLVSQLVDDGELRTARQERVEVHLLEDAPFVGDAPARHDLQPVEQRRRLAPTVRLDHADNDIDALGLAPRRGQQHGVGLSDARRRADEDLQAPPPLRSRQREERFR